MFNFSIMNSVLTGSNRQHFMIWLDGSYVEYMYDWRTGSSSTTVVDSDGRTLSRDLRRTHNAKLIRLQNEHVFG